MHLTNYSINKHNENFEKKMASVCVIFFWPFCFYCSLVFYILGAFLIKQLFHSRLLDMR